MCVSVAFFFEKKIQLNSSGKEKHNCRQSYVVDQNGGQKQISLYIYAMIQIFTRLLFCSSICLICCLHCSYCLFFSLLIFFFKLSIEYPNITDFFRKYSATPQTQFAHIYRFIYRVWP